MRSATYLFAFAVIQSILTLSCGKAENNGDVGSNESIAQAEGGAVDMGGPSVVPPSIQANQPLVPPSIQPNQPVVPPSIQPNQPVVPPSIQPNQPVIPPFLTTSNLFVVLGGNGSCLTTSTSKVFPGLIDARIFQSFTESIFLTGMVRPEDQVIFACYEFMSTEMRFYEIRGEQRMTQLNETQLDALVLSRAQLATKVVIMGHSWGGWRAMKLASSPYLLNNLRVPMILVSLDPISKVMCQRLLEAGCREAPSDLNSSELYQLNTRMRWLNAYQETGLFLGSGPLSAAHFNVRSNANHLAIQSDESVWAAIRSFVGSFLVYPY